MLNFNKIPVGVVLIQDGEIKQINKKINDYYEFAIENIKQVGPNYFFNKQEQFEKYIELVGKGKVGTIKTTNRLQPKGLIHLDIHVGYLIDNEEKYTMLIIVETSSIEQMKKLLRKKSQLISALPQFIFSMRSLLTVIYGYSQLLKLKLVNHETYKFVDDLDVSIKKTTELFDKMYKTLQDEEITLDDLEEICKQVDENKTEV